MEIAFVLGLLAVAIALFASEVVPVDVTTLLLLLALVVGGTLTPREAFAGFASELILTLIAIFVLSGALQQTGAVSNLAERLERAPPPTSPSPAFSRPPPSGRSASSS